MKKIFLITALVVLSATLIAQEPLSKTDYLRKAKRQNTAGWVLLSGGFLMGTTGIMVSAAQTDDIFYGLVTFEEPQVETTGPAILIIGGCALMLSSIPLFISSSKNKLKAATAFIRMETQIIPKQGTFIKTSFPSVGIRIPLSN